MRLHQDTILDGVRPADIEQIRRLAEGRAVELGAPDLNRLQANGWVEIAHGTPLITLTGRTLLEQPRR